MDQQEPPLNSTKIKSCTWEEAVPSKNQIFYPMQERHQQTEAIPAEGQQDAQKAGALALWGETKEQGLFCLEKRQLLGD